MSDEEYDEEHDDEEEVFYILDTSDVRVNAWTVAMVFLELPKNILIALVTFFNALSILTERKSDHKEDQRVLHDAVTADLESLPVTEGPNAAA